MYFLLVFFCVPRFITFFFFSFFRLTSDFFIYTYVNFFFFGSFGACHQHAMAHICTSAGPLDLNMKHSSDVHKHAAECTYMAWRAHGFTRANSTRCALVLTDSRSAHLQTSPSHSPDVLPGQWSITSPPILFLKQHARRWLLRKRPGVWKLKTLTKTFCQTTGVLLATSSH